MVRQERQEKILKGTLVSPKNETIMLSTGVVLKKKDIPKLVLKRLYDQYEEQKPKVPLFFNEDKEREEENPADPAYLEELDAYTADMGLTILNFSIMWGTELVSKPNSIEGPEDSGWYESLKFSGVDVSDIPQIRYMTWVATIAAPQDSDIQLLAEALRGGVGVTEEAVAEEMAKFPSDTQRGDDSETTTEIPSSDGN
jgi:hypothetical protein